MMKVCIGGAFDVLHKGHKTLIDKAFQIAGKSGSVFIGLTIRKISDKKSYVKSFETREQALIKYLHEKKFTNKYEVTIKPIKDKYGPSVEEEFDAIVVSPETFKTAEEINKKRIKKGRKTLKIVKIPFVLAEDGVPISSSRIKNKEIDINGKVQSKD